ncbi:MAG TPA: restriction endonuclease [Flavisolibacter sp.]|nr:restriction endonuclease [Flavisolibacter sp.]
MIPDYQSLLSPILKIADDGNEHDNNEITGILAEQFNLTEEELNQWVPSGQQRVFANRVTWAKSFLKQAKLIRPVKKSVFIITDKGKEVLKQYPNNLNIKILKQLPSYQEYKNENSIADSDGSTEDISLETPEEQIESGYEKIRKSLEQELISKLKSIDPYFFERIVVELLVKMGYGGSIQDAGKAIGKSGDEGIDGIIKEDKLGLDVIYIQAKRWEGIVGRPEIQKFVGALAGQRAKKGVFITTSNFSKEAITYASQMDTKIVLIDGEQLAQYMIDYNLGVSVQNTYEIKKIDSDYFEEE